MDKEYINIYASLSSTLNVNQFKWKLEDCFFRHLYPVEYKCIAKLLHERRIDRELYVNKFVNKLHKSIKKEGIEAEVYGRPKHIYSIWRKMQKKHLSFDKIFDVLAVRIVANCMQDCYTVLEIIHTNFFYLPEEFDDYISNPKPNGYQSIHTVVLDSGGRTIEVQIRTKQMHKDAELGLAAHWKYKRDDSSWVYPDWERYTAWLHRMILWYKMIIAKSSEVPNEIQNQVLKDWNYIFKLKYTRHSVLNLKLELMPNELTYHTCKDTIYRHMGIKSNISHK